MDRLKTYCTQSLLSNVMVQKASRLLSNVKG